MVFPFDPSAQPCAAPAPDGRMRGREGTGLDDETGQKQDERYSWSRGPVHTRDVAALGPERLGDPLGLGSN